MFLIIVANPLTIPTNMLPNTGMNALIKNENIFQLRPIILNGNKSNVLVIPARDVPNNLAPNESAHFKKRFVSALSPPIST